MSIVSGIWGQWSCSSEEGQGGTLDWSIKAGDHDLWLTCCRQLVVVVKYSRWWLKVVWHEVEGESRWKTSVDIEGMMLMNEVWMEYKNRKPSADKWSVYLKLEVSVSGEKETWSGAGGKSLYITLFPPDHMPRLYGAPDQPRGSLWKAKEGNYGCLWPVLRVVRWQNQLHLSAEPTARRWSWREDALLSKFSPGSSSKIWTEMACLRCGGVLWVVLAFWYCQDFWVCWGQWGAVYRNLPQKSEKIAWCVFAFDKAGWYGFYGSI